MSAQVDTDFPVAWFLFGVFFFVDEVQEVLSVNPLELDAFLALPVLELQAVFVMLDRQANRLSSLLSFFEEWQKDSHKQVKLSRRLSDVEQVLVQRYRDVLQVKLQAFEIVDVQFVEMLVCEILELVLFKTISESFFVSSENAVSN